MAGTMPKKVLLRPTPGWPLENPPHSRYLGGTENIGIL